MIPRILFNDKNLSNTDRVLLGLIISLALKNNYCYANNKYLATYIDSSVRTITYSLSKLKKLNYIIVKYENSKRRIYLNTEKVPLKSARDSANNCNLTIAENCNHNIKNNYKRKNNINSNEITPYWMKHSEVCNVKIPNEEEFQEIEEILKELN